MSGHPPSKGRTRPTQQLLAQAGPSAYRLKVQGWDKIVERLVDPVEVFNYLLGIEVDASL